MFKKAGYNLALDGSEDHLLASELKEIWDDLNMSCWRQSYMQEMEVLSAEELWHSMECWHSELDIEGSDDSEAQDDTPVLEVPLSQTTPTNPGTPMTFNPNPNEASSSSQCTNPSLHEAFSSHGDSPRLHAAGKGYPRQTRREEASHARRQLRFHDEPAPWTQEETVLFVTAILASPQSSQDFQFT